VVRLSVFVFLLREGYSRDVGAESLFCKTHRLRQNESNGV
jgi:hypothetical protein